MCLTREVPNNPRKLRTRPQKHTHESLQVPGQSLLHTWTSNQHRNLPFQIGPQGVDVDIPLLVRNLCASDLQKCQLPGKEAHSDQKLRPSCPGAYMNLQTLNDAHAVVFRTVDQTPILRWLNLWNASLSTSQLKMILSSVLDVTLFEVHLFSRTTTRLLHETFPWFPKSMRHLVARLQNSCSLHWSASGMTVHIDDLLRILHACSYLVSLKLEEINVIHLGLDTNVSPNIGSTLRSPDPPFPLVPIPDSDLNRLNSGRQLNMFT
ncbi:MAG: hypothetical protein BYD32DRAFT_440609 [Podila humilis]|nr:MAG: hypothetical protein BYD32DRAFT_440609 [Podila humilis]